MIRNTMNKKYVHLYLALLSLSFLGMYVIKQTQKKLAQATGKEEKTKIMELASAFILSRAIHTAAEIKVADHMVNGPQNIQLLAQKTNMNEDALYRLLRLWQVMIFLAMTHTTIFLSHRLRSNLFQLIPILYGHG